MLTFRQWLAKPIKLRKKENDPRQPNQGSSTIGTQDVKGKNIGSDKSIEIGRSEYIPEPK